MDKSGINKSISNVTAGASWPPSPALSASLPVVSLSLPACCPLSCCISGSVLLSHSFCLQLSLELSRPLTSNILCLFLPCFVHLIINSSVKQTSVRAEGTFSPWKVPSLQWWPSLGPPPPASCRALHRCLLPERGKEGASHLT